MKIKPSETKEYFPNFISIEILNENIIKCFTLKLVNTTSTKLFFLFFLTISICSAQKQLVFLKHDNVIARFTEGDRFKFKLKNKKWKEGFVYELTDYSLITSGLDTIPFLSIDKIRAKRQGVNASQGVGGLLFLGGLLYIAIDQANVLYGSTKGGFDGTDQTALALAGAGAAILFIKPKYKRVSRGGIVIRAIDYRSLYYKSNP
jgi:hypothetical protein